MHSKPNAQMGDHFAAPYTLANNLCEEVPLVELANKELHFIQYQTCTFLVLECLLSNQNPQWNRR